MYYPQFTGDDATRPAESSRLEMTKDWVKMQKSGKSFAMVGPTLDREFQLMHNPTQNSLQACLSSGHYTAGSYSSNMTAFTIVYRMTSPSPHVY